jgi:hypothetical protein
MARFSGRSSSDGDEMIGGIKHVSSDQAPGEETVQVNDQYSGGGPPPEPAQSEHGQHQTGG